MSMCSVLHMPFANLIATFAALDWPRPLVVGSFASLCLVVGMFDLFNILCIRLITLD